MMQSGETNIERHLVEFFSRLTPRSFALGKGLKNGDASPVYRLDDAGVRDVESVDRRHLT